MKDHTQMCSVTTSIDVTEKEVLCELAKKLGMSRANLMRRAIQTLVYLRAEELIDLQIYYGAGLSSSILREHARQIGRSIAQGFDPVL